MRVPLGRTGIEVTRLGLGLASLGGMFAPVDDATAAATIDRAWRLGVRVAAIRAACARFDVPPLAAAIQFPFRHPAVAGVVVGARAPHEIAESVALLDHPVPEELWDLLSTGSGSRSTGR